MSSVIVAAVCLTGFAISIFANMAAIETKRWHWNLLTVGFGIAVNAAYAFVNNKTFDYIAALLFVAFLLGLGWLVARFELPRK